MNGYGVWFDRIPGYDQYALYISKGTGYSPSLYLRSDGEWVQSEPGGQTEPVLTIHGVDWHRNTGLRAELIKALGGLPEAAADTEVRVLREWLDVERSRVERAFDR